MDNLDLLEDRIHFLAVRYTQINEENNQLKRHVRDEQKRNENLKKQITNLKEEKEKFEVVKKSVKKKIELLISQLSFEDASEEPEKLEAISFASSSNTLTLEEAEALNRPLTEDILNDTPINFLQEEDA